MNHFSKANWSALYKLGLGKYFFNADQNQIGDRGCKYLSRVKLNSIKILFLSTQ
jgi:hypothetical protein